MRAISKTRLAGSAAVAALALTALCAFAAPAQATSPWWHASTRMFPSNVPPGGEATVVLTALNLGDGQATGVPTLTQSFPEGFSVQSVELYALFVEQGKIDLANVFSETFNDTYCTHGTGSAQCRVDLAQLANPEFGGFNREEPVLNPYEDIEMRVTVKNEGAVATGAQMSGEVSGGGAPKARVAQSLPVTAAAPTFGVAGARRRGRRGGRPGGLASLSAHDHALAQRGPRPNQAAGDDS